MISGSFKFGNMDRCLHPRTQDAILRDEEPMFDAARRARSERVSNLYITREQPCLEIDRLSQASRNVRHHETMISTAAPEASSARRSV